MATDKHPVHILFFPFLAPGHLIPAADMAALFAMRGVKTAIMTTPANAGVIRSAIDRANDAFRGTDTPPITLSLVAFPDVGLPPGMESSVGIASDADRAKFFHALHLLREPFDQFVIENRPDAVVVDSFYMWAADAAAEHGIPRLVFMGTSLFARSVQASALRNDPMAAASEAEAADPDALVALPGLPHRVQLRRSQMMDSKKQPGLWALFRSMDAADQRSYGEVSNSFRELEPDYAEHYHTALGRRVWLVGPVALFNKDAAARGSDKLSVDAGECLRWLGAKPPGSVVYVCFGTLSKFSPAQLRELACGLEASGKSFIWVVQGANAEAAEQLPEGFEERTARDERGLIIRGWAPQVLILNHRSAGGFVTHCGWNSCLEAVSAGVPMVTWPLYADQFYNERLVVEVLKAGVGVGSRDFATRREERQVIAREVVADAIGKVMGEGEGAEAIRRAAKELGEKARAAVAEGGSSHADVGRLIDELMARRSGQVQND